MKYKKIKGVVSAGHKLTVQAGREILCQGGNAIDAAVASFFAACVVEHCLTSLGGGGFALIHTAAGKNLLLDFFGQTPTRKRKGKVDFKTYTVRFGDADQDFHIGVGAMAVPGNAVGVLELHKKFGRLPIAVVAEPAIRIARDGFRLDNYGHYVLTLLEGIFAQSKESERVYFKNGKLQKPGEVIKMPDFAGILELLAEKEGGKKLYNEFYYGEIAKKIVKACEEKGGHLTSKDLADYRVILRNPLTINYRGNKIYTNPPPSSGGVLIGFTLSLLENFDLEKYKFGSSEHLFVLTEAMRLANEARAEILNGKLHDKNIAKKFLSQESIKKYRRLLSRAVNKLGSTTHISVIDGEGNAVSMTTSNGEGCGYIIPGTGIMMNNLLGEEDLHPNGFHKWPVNKRIGSMMAPTIVLKNNKPEIVLGSGGSNRIRTAITQVISNIIDFNMPAKTAVNKPRIHWEKGALYFERSGFNKKELEKFLKAAQGKGYTINPFKKINMFFGGAHVAVKDENGRISGAGDPRRNGVCAECK
jgi:gamma-glutamyltranspeptidase/glutathione hydrolase